MLDMALPGEWPKESKGEGAALNLMQLIDNTQAERGLDSTIHARTQQ